jgi:hypothetical protein
VKLSILKYMQSLHEACENGDWLSAVSRCIDLQLHLINLLHEDTEGGSKPAMPIKAKVGKGRPA